jgi:hypothetical protein
VRRYAARISLDLYRPADCDRGGIGYTPVTDDCTGAAHAFLRFIDADPSARGVSSNK